MTTPFEVPGAFDVIELDRQPMRGIWKRASGGDRIQKVEQVQSPQYLGAYTMVRLEEMVTLDYEVEVWTIEDYNWLRTMLQVLRQGMKKRVRGPRVYELQDLTLEHIECKNVVCYKLTGLRHIGKGKHSTVIGFAEWKRKVPVGGPPKAAPKSDLEKQVERMNNENKALQAQLDGARAKGK